MVSDFNVLTASQNSQLFAIQQTSRALETAQTRLSTGQRVNNATDNPQNYFTAFSLNSRASQLNTVLDRIGQSVLAIQSADNATNSLTNLIDTARSSAETAKESLQTDAQDLGARILEDSPIIYYRLDETSGTTATNLGSAGATLNGTYQGGISLNQGALTFSLNNNSISFDGTSGNVAIPNNALVNTSAVAERTVELTFRADNLNGRQVLFEEGGGTNAIALYLDDDQLYFAARDSGDFGPFNISVEVEEGVTYQAAFTLSASQGRFTGYLNGEEVGFGTVTQALSAHSGAVALGRNSGGTHFHDGANGGNGEYFQGQISDFALYNTTLTQQNLQDRYAITQLDQAENYKQEVLDILSQANDLAEDSAFQGINLLNNDSLNIQFNPGGSSSLDIEGVDLTSSGLGFTDFDFTDFNGIDSALLEIDDATGTIENFSTGLANDLTIVENRQDFINNTINNLTAGADDLLAADLDEESANILALQAQQAIQLETLSLSAKGSSIADFLGRSPFE